jgi:hypothetical protein
MELHNILACARRQAIAEIGQQEADETDDEFDARVDAQINALSNVDLLDLVERASS